MRTKAEYDLVLKLHLSGCNQTKISYKTGIPRSTIKDWLKKIPFSFTSMDDKFELKNKIVANKNLQSVYSYLLGLYLGDGYINKCKRTFRLRIFLDEKYLKLNKYAEERMKKLFLKNKINVSLQKNKSCICLSVYNNELNDIFPQNGLKKKYERKIELLEWQKEIIAPIELLKGLIHSDGCFYTEKINDKYTYERFVFSNKSIDLHDIFQKACNTLNIEYDFQHKGNVNFAWQTRISKKESVKKLKQIIGTKDMPM